MKRLYAFTLPKEVTVEETTSNEDGSKTITPVKKVVQQKFFLRKPGRNLSDDAELFYAITLSDAIRRGCMTHAQLSKRYANDHGTLSDDEKKEYADLYVKLFEKQQEFQSVSLKKDADRTPEEKEVYKTLVREIADITEKIQHLEVSQISLFDQTAENIARNKTIRWWTLILAYTEDDGKEAELFGAGTHEERLKAFDEMSERSDAFLENVIKHFLYYVSFWYVGRASVPEDFEKLSIV